MGKKEVQTKENGTTIPSKSGFGAFLKGSSGAYQCYTQQMRIGLIHMHHVSIQAQLLWLDPYPIKTSAAKRPAVVANLRSPNILSAVSQTADVTKQKFKQAQTPKTA